MGMKFLFIHPVYDCILWYLFMNLSQLVIYALSLKERYGMSQGVTYAMLTM